MAFHIFYDRPSFLTAFSRRCSRIYVKYETNVFVYVCLFGEARPAGRKLDTYILRHSLNQPTQQAGQKWKHNQPSAAGRILWRIKMGWLL